MKKESSNEKALFYLALLIGSFCILWSCVSSMNIPHASNLQKTTRRGAQIIFFVLATLCLLFVMSYASRLNEYARVQHESTLWDQKNEDARRRQAELLAYLDYVQSDAHIAEVAREELNMVQPDDNVVVVIASDGQEKIVQRANDGAINALVVPIPVWQQWFNLFAQQPTSTRIQR